ncbi:MAG: glycosyltransferase family 2 protein [Anaerorhabdus sp.]
MREMVSIVVPVYNVENYIDRCILSLLNQTYFNIEIILVNDGSTDNSAAKCHKYSLDDNRIKVIDKENGGLSDARNVGIQHASGDYLLFVDSDDYVASDMVEIMVDKITSENGDICVCDMEYHFDDGRKSFSCGGKFSSCSINDNPSLIRINNSACNKLYKKYLFNDIVFPVNKVYEDLATIPKLLYLAKKVVKVDKALYFYYQRTGSIVHVASKKIFDIYDAIDNCIKYVQSKGAKSVVLEELYHLYIVHGLDITTVKIKDFENKEMIDEYLLENMRHLRKYYPEYRHDAFYKNASFKKKIIYKLLDTDNTRMVRFFYGK